MVHTKSEKLLKATFEADDQHQADTQRSDVVKVASSSQNGRRSEWWIAMMEVGSYKQSYCRASAGSRGRRDPSRTAAAG